MDKYVSAKSLSHPAIISGQGLFSGKFWLLSVATSVWGTGSSPGRILKKEDTGTKGKENYMSFLGEIFSTSKDGSKEDASYTNGNKEKQTDFIFTIQIFV